LGSDAVGEIGGVSILNRARPPRDWPPLFGVNDRHRSLATTSRRNRHRGSTAESLRCRYRVGGHEPSRLWRWCAFLPGRAACPRRGGRSPFPCCSSVSPVFVSIRNTRSSINPPRYSTGWQRFGYEPP